MSGEGGGLRLFRVLVAVALATYPLAVYFGISWLRPGMFGVMLAGLALIRLVIAPEGLRTQLPMVLPMIAIIAYSLTVAITGDLLLLRFYPVLVSAIMGAAFASTLWNRPVMIERIARMRGIELSADATPYLRWVTIVWTMFFVANGTFAAYTATQTGLKFWALYNGLISYCLIGALIVLELPIRKAYKARMGHQEPSNSA